MYISGGARVLTAALLASIIFQFSPRYAHAWYISSSGATVCTSINDVAFNKGFKCLEGVTENVFKGVISLIVIGMLAMLIIGGMRYATAGGDQKSVDLAKKTITYAVLGLAIALAGYYLLSVLGNTIGLPDLLKFELPQPAV